MTFSIIGRCPVSGSFGAATATSTIAVGARVAHCAGGIGAVLTQHRPDPRLGPRGLDLLRSGCSAQEAVDALVASNPQVEWRQLAVLDSAGRAAVYSGSRTRPEVSDRTAGNVCAIGNLLSNVRVTAAMVRGYEADPSAPLPERLMRALEEGLAAGGQQRPLRSAHLLVVDSDSLPSVDLRIDWHERPIAELRSLWNRYAPEMGAYRLRAHDPGNPMLDGWD
jgi:uncharacterized Ntn-hydrolase superfamily protein